MGIGPDLREKIFRSMNVSYGRNRGQLDGDVVYIITYWVGIDTDETNSLVFK